MPLYTFLVTCCQNVPSECSLSILSNTIMCYATWDNQTGEFYRWLIQVLTHFILAESYGDDIWSSVYHRLPSLHHVPECHSRENQTIQVSLPEGEDTVGQLNQTLLLFSLVYTTTVNILLYTVLQALMQSHWKIVSENMVKLIAHNLMSYAWAHWGHHMHIQSLCIYWYSEDSFCHCLWEFRGFSLL